MKLSKRLQSILDHSLDNEPFWDFCCDHGQLGEKAHLSGRFSEIHFVDQVPHIIEALEKRMEHNSSGDQSSAKKIKIHLMAGEKVAEPVTGNLTIAGVGGNTVVKILNDLDVNSFLHAKRIILNPATRKDVLSSWLAKWSKYQLVGEYSFVEGGLERTLFVLDAKA